MAQHTHDRATDIGLLALRATFGGLMAGHGAQKLFGSFGGYGLQGTAGWMESMGMKPGKAWAVLAGGSEFGSGVLTALGLAHPVGPISIFAPMIMAWAKAHNGKPIWVTAGGAELPLAFMVGATTLSLTGPGRYSLDSALDIEVPTWAVALTALGVAAGVAVGVMQVAPAQQEQIEQQAEQQAEQPAKQTNQPPAQEPPTVQSADTPDTQAIEATGGIGQDADEEDRDEAAEVGADPPGGFGLDLRDGVGGSSPANDTTETDKKKE